jgi:hypothetical protein
MARITGCPAMAGSFPGNGFLRRTMLKMGLMTTTRALRWCTEVAKIDMGVAAIVEEVIEAEVVDVAEGEHTETMVKLSR